MENWKFRKALDKDVTQIWDILQQAILKRKEEGSTQWQDGYPNPEVIKADISQGFGYVALDENQQIIGYIAIINDLEPAYETIEGDWETDAPYTTIHRLAVKQDSSIKGLGTWLMERGIDYARSTAMKSVRADTNFDNMSMLRVFEKLSFKETGTVYFRGSARIAFELVIKEKEDNH